MVRAHDHSVALPAIYITATALGKLGHPDGEKNLTWAGAKQGIIQVRRIQVAKFARVRLIDNAAH